MLLKIVGYYKKRTSAVNIYKSFFLLIDLEAQMDENQSGLLEILKDLVKINSIIATELIQLVENSSSQLRGDIPDSCIGQHRELRKDIIRIAEKWNTDCEVLRDHNLKHG
jgi:hypothetical protein